VTVGQFTLEQSKKRNLTGYIPVIGCDKPADAETPHGGLRIRILELGEDYHAFCAS
jgi:hypothetical protein